MSSIKQPQAIAIIIGVLILGAMVSGQKGQPTTAAATAAPAATRAPTPTPVPTEPPHIGTVVDLGNWRYRVMQVDTTTDQLLCGDPYHGADKPKGMWVVVMLDLTNRGDRNYSMNTWDIELRDDKGIKYDMAWLPSAVCSEGRGHTSLGDQMPPGVTVRTTLLFDVAPGTTGMYLYLSNVGLADKPGVIYLY